MFQKKDLYFKIPDWWLSRMAYFFSAQQFTDKNEIIRHHKSFYSSYSISSSQYFSKSIMNKDQYFSQHNKKIMGNNQTAKV